MNLYAQAIAQYRVLCVLLLVVFLPQLSVAQFCADAFMLKKAGDEFNERGYSKSKAINVDGSMSVSNTSGGLSYVYPLYSFSENGIPFNLSLNYCNSVQVTAFQMYSYSKYGATVENTNSWCGDDAVYIDGIKIFTGNPLKSIMGGTTAIPLEGWSKFQQSRPLWIVGFAGFAVQTLSATASYLSPTGYISSQNTQTDFGDGNFNWIVDGYDYCNRMEDFYMRDKVSGAKYVDRIRLLKADGSVMELFKQSEGYRTDTNETLRSDIYTGYYAVADYNNKSYALVEYDSTYWNSSGSQTTQISQRLPEQYRTTNNRDLFPRKVRYFPGDGLEYVFREWILSYGLSIYYKNIMSAYSDGNAISQPKIFYLEEIRQGDKALISFARSRHYPTYGAYELDNTTGRAFCTEITSDTKTIRLRLGYNALFVEAGGRTTKAIFNTVRRSGSAQNNASPFADIGYSNYYTDATDNSNKASYAGYINKIIDPEGRTTEFVYESYNRKYHNLSFPLRENSSLKNNLSFNNYRIKTIKEPALQYNFTYYGDSSATIDMNNVSGGDLFYNRPNYKLNNVVKKVEKLSRTDNVLLSKDEYDFTYPGTATYDPSMSIKVKSTDLITNKSKSIQYTYVKEKTPAFYEHIADNAFESYYTYLSQMLETQDTLSKATATVEMPLDSTESKFQWVPKSRNVTTNGYQQEREEYYYTKSVLKDFGSFHSNYLRKIVSIDKDSSVLRYPNNTSRTWLATVNYYQNFPRLDTAFTLTDTIRTWDKFATLKKYFEIRNNPEIAGKRWEDVMCQITVMKTIMENTSYSFTYPAITGLPVKQLVYDENGNILAGKIMKYEDKLYVGGHLTFSRGKIIADTLIGYGGIKQAGNEYTYTREYMRNLPSGAKNANGAQSYNRYDYNLPEFLTSSTSACEQYDAKSRIMSIDNVESTQPLEGGYTYLYDEPLAQIGTVRKYTPSGSIDTTRLLQLFERTYFGLASKTVDPNGWTTSYTYDANGRVRNITLPYDFLAKDTAVTAFPTTVNATYRFDAVGYTTHSARLDTVVCKSSHTSCKKEGTALREDYPSVLRAARYLTIEPHCLWDTTVGSITHSTCDSGEIAPHKGNPVQVTANHRLPFEYMPCDTGKVSLNVPKANIARLDSAYAVFNVSSVRGSCVSLRFTFPQINYTQSFVLNCSDDLGDSGGGGTTIMTGGKGSGGATTKANKLMSDDTVSNLKTLIINLTSKKTQIAALDLLEVRISTSTPSASVDFANDAEDTRPALKLLGSFKVDKQQLASSYYTVQYEYGDENSDYKTTVRAKVDDVLHTANTYDAVVTPIRNSESVFRLRGDGAVQKAITTIGNPTSPLRKDTVKTSANGWGQKLFVTDQLGYTTTTLYDAASRPVQTVNPDTTAVVMSYEYGTPAHFGINDGTQDFYGWCQRTITINETGKKAVQYSDPLGRVRREILDPDTLNLTTRYEYDIQGRLTYVLNPKGDTTRYWYDAWGRIKYKYQPDMGFTSYTYDKLGNVRFSQTQQQADADRMSYFEYDDMNRLLISGEALLRVCGSGGDSSGSGGSGGMSIITGGNSHSASNSTKKGGARLQSMLTTDTLNLNRWTDRISPNYLHDNGASAILTANRSLWLTPSTLFPLPQLLHPDSIAVQSCTDIAARALSGLFNPAYPPVQPLLKHPAYYYPYLPAVAVCSSDFEHIGMNSRFVNTAVWYDTIPSQAGAIWSTMPPKSKWDALAPKGSVRNQKGRESAVAYRSHGGQPFHFVVMSYDERGRVEAVLRYTENLGFDAVYYSYNSMNLVTSVRTADAQRQHTTWYGYNHNGQMDSVWTSLSSTGLGLGTAMAYPTAPAHQRTADISYTYTKRGQVEQQRYLAINATITNGYTKRGWLDTSGSWRNGGRVFSQQLSYDAAGQILLQSSRQGNAAVRTQSYNYDRANRLTQWLCAAQMERYAYDAVGNRTMLKAGADSTVYSYGMPGSEPNRLLGTWLSANQNSSMSYYANGALHTRQQRKSSSASFIHRIEEFFYTPNGLVERYTMKESRTPRTAESSCLPNASTAPEWDWRYRYSAGGEREQKRLYGSPDGDSLGKIHAWVYYLLGGGNKQLAVYNGVQTTDALCGNSGGSSGRNVWLFPVEFNSFGVGSNPAITTRPNGTKEYNFDDHLGNVRVILSSTGRTLTRADYKPFGGELWSFAGKSRRTFIGKEKDKESELGDFGVRKYDEEIGRFTSIDPLWESYTSLSPYHYSCNNPISLCDPTGYAADASGVTSYDEANKTNVLKTLKEDLEQKTGLTLTVNEQGMMEYAKIDGKPVIASGQTSEKARNLLMSWIDDPNNTMNIYAIDGSAKGSQQTTGTNDIWLDVSQIEGFINGAVGVNSTTMGFALTFLHEGCHTVMGGSYSDNDEFGKLGDVEEKFINPIRAELGSEYGQRCSYQSIEIGSSNGSPNVRDVVIPFSKAGVTALKRGGLPYPPYIKHQKKR